MRLEVEDVEAGKREKLNQTQHLMKELDENLVFHQEGGASCPPSHRVLCTCVLIG